MILEKVYQKNARGELLLLGCNIKTLPVNGRHHMYTKQIAEWGEQVAIDGNTFTFKNATLPPQLFTIDHPPGTYCCHDGKRIEVPAEEAALPIGHADHGKSARAYVAKHHKGKASPDKSHPSGYKVKDYYGVTVGAA